MRTHCPRRGSWRRETRDAPKLPLHVIAAAIRFLTVQSRNRWRGAFGDRRAMVETVTEQPRTRRCDECKSDFFAAMSPMSTLCPECAYRMYGYPPCAHEFVGGLCARCGWDGSVSAYLGRLQPPPVE